MKVYSYNRLTNNEHMYFRYNIAVCILDYFKERHGDNHCASLDKAITMMDNLENYGYMLYFVVDNTKEDIVVGFVILHIDNQYGMVNEYLVVDYMYVIPSYRNRLATRLLFTTVGKCSLDLQLDVVGCTLLGNNNNVGNVSSVGGKTIGMLQTIARQDFIDKYKKYMKGYK